MVEIGLVNIDDAYYIRNLILRPNQPLESCKYEGDHDELTRHFGVFEDEAIKGIISIYNQEKIINNEKACWRIRGMATVPDARGRGFGRLLAQSAIDYVRSEDPKPIWCNARTAAVPFYEKVGFKKIGNEFEIEGIGPHFVVLRTLV